MTVNDPVINLLADANPVPAPASQDANERLQAERIRDRVVSSAPGGRHRPPILAPAMGVLVVLAVVALFLGVGGPSRTKLPAGGGSEIILRAEPAAQTPVLTQAAMSRTVGILRARLGSVFHHFRVTRVGDRNVVIVIHDAAGSTRARVLALTTTPARLSFYDWEANVLTPDGATVASRLQRHDATALTISQGSAMAAPGESGAGGLPLFQAVELASAHPAAPTSSPLARHGTQHYVFGAPGSAACAAAARAGGTTPTPGAHCLLAGPDASTPGAPAGSPAEIGHGQRQLLDVPRGTAVLEAANPAAPGPANVNDPRARFFVLNDNPSLTGKDITHPRPSTDASGSPDVTFAFTLEGRQAFKRATAGLAQRGTQTSSVGQALNQHFAIALDQQLITVPSVDFKVYPDGISTGDADITGGLTARSSRDLAAMLRFGPLPVNLVSVG